MKTKRQFYQIIVDGELDPLWSPWFDGLVITWRASTDEANPGRQTVLSGYVPDQARLYGMLNKLRDLNLSLVAVTRCDPPQLMVDQSAWLSESQVALVQQSFGQLRGREGELATVFYTRLFELDPALRLLFQRTREEQARKFFAMLSIVVNGLLTPESLLPIVRGLGRRHVDYGVKAEHYALVGEVLLWALANVLGAAFTPLIMSAWTAAYRALAAAMQEA